MLAMSHDRRIGRGVPLATHADVADQLLVRAHRPLDMPLARQEHAPPRPMMFLAERWLEREWARRCAAQILDGLAGVCVERFALAFVLRLMNLDDIGNVL